MPILSKGLIQVYTGHGKGKTTAAMGLACRMLGVGGRVYICQFLKPPSCETGETQLAAWLGPQLTFDRVDHPWDMTRSLDDPATCRTAKLAIAAKLCDIESLAAKGDYDLIILDELVFSLSIHLAEWPQVERLLDNRARHVEIVLTGRNADPKLIAKADLVSEIIAIKHPYQQGIPARKGVEF